MMLGGTTIFKCPKCNQWIKTGPEILRPRRTIWSDGLANDFEFSKYVSINCCPHCELCSLSNEFKCIDYMLGMADNEVEYYMDGLQVVHPDQSILKERYKNVPHFASTELDILIKALQYIGKGENELRLKIWQVYNNRFRIDNMKPFDSKEEQDYINNIKILIDWLDAESDDEKLFLAELYRNIGEFEKSKSIILTRKDKTTQWISDPMILEIEQKNKKPILLQLPLNG